MSLHPIEVTELGMARIGSEGGKWDKGGVPWSM